MTVSRAARQIAALGRLCGILPGFRDNQGRRHRTSINTYQALLTAMGVPWADPEAREREISRLREKSDRLLAPVTAVFFQKPLPVMVRAPHSGLAADYWAQGELTSEDGRCHHFEGPLKLRSKAPQRGLFGGWRLAAALPLPEGSAPGYYHLKLQVRCHSETEAGATFLIVAPDTAFQPPCLAGDRRLWGISLPLYALTSDRNWGMGDFTDLGEVLRWAGDLGAAFVGVNPLHALPLPLRTDISPYSPTSRQFLNFLYLDLEQVPEFKDSPEAQALLTHPEFQKAKAAARTGPWVNYPEVCRLKRQLLGPLFEAFRARHGGPQPATHRGQEFRRFVRESGETLQRFARFSALAEYFEEPDWRRWPPEYHHPESPQVTAFAREHPAAVGFHQYVLWLTEAQWRGVQEQAGAAGLPFSLYQDLALGAAPGGFETWAYPGLFALKASMGAPPDAFNPKGQDWGLPPMIPERLRELRFQPFIDILRANLPINGLLRLDHVMALFRVFWVPSGGGKVPGAYVRYPAPELLAILALESHRRRTLMVGEDLGTVAPYIRRELQRRGIFSYRVFYFERKNGEFLEPQAYPRQAVAAVTTHDLPTLAGYWEGRDIRLKESLNLYPRPGMAAADEAARAGDRQQMVEALTREGLLPPGYVPPPGSCPAEVRRGVLSFLARSRAALLEVRLEDLLGLTFQQNLPGTIQEHPNWRQKLAPPWEELKENPEVMELATLISKERRPGGGNEGS